MYDIPVILVCYKRPFHTAQVLHALMEHGIQNLIIFSDAPKTADDVEGVRQTRTLLNNIHWTRPDIIYQHENQGLARSIVAAANYALEKHDSFILLEDDCVPHAYFYDWFRTCLERYKNVPEVFGISGYSIPIPVEIRSTYPYDAYFFPRMGSWGWATWKDRWKKDNRNLAELTMRSIEEGVDLEQGGRDVPNFVGDILLGKVTDTWTLPWLVNVYLNRGCYIYPTVSHINNIGLDGTGVHCGKTDKYNTTLCNERPERYPDKPVFEDRIRTLFMAYQNVSSRSYDDNTLFALAKFSNLQTLKSSLTFIPPKLALDKPVYINLGCGKRVHPNWLNYDFSSNHPEVQQADLRRGIPLPENHADAVYHSHVLEHFSKPEAPKFIAECFRVLKPGGILRVAVPNLEVIASLYLHYLDKSLTGDIQAEDRYDCIMLEMYDQAVRNRSGGAMLDWWIQPQLKSEDFIIERLGDEVKDTLQSLRNSNTRPTHLPEPTDPVTIGNFRLSGEVHQWMYDRFSLARLLRQCGFRDVRTVQATESGIPGFSTFLLDSDEHGNIRKPDSLFMEASK